MERIMFDNSMNNSKNSDAHVIKYPEKRTHPEPLSKNARKGNIKMNFVKPHCHPCCQM